MTLTFILFLTACSVSPTSAPVTPSPPLLSETATAAPTANTTPTLIIPTSTFIEATPRAPLDVRGTFVYSAGDGSLWLQHARGGAPTTLIERSKEAIAQLPSFSPDGQRVIYSALLFLADGNLRGDIRSIDSDGKNARTLIHATVNDVVYLYPRVAPNGRLLVTRVENLQTSEERAQLEWWSAETQTTQPVVRNARDADVSHDSAHIVFVRYNVQNAETSLWLANADGTGEKELVRANVFDNIQAPRFSPDGRWIAFGVHGAPHQSLPLTASLGSQLTSNDACVLRVLFCIIETAHAHPAPGALWRVNLETNKFEALTNVYDDSPLPAWSSDGSQIAIHDFTGIRLIDLARKEIYPLFLEDGGSGGFDWSDQ
ncbi:MAG TPA: hypothetical protein VFD70_26375 [Anaerolineae bacterium]|nr:hypothetical protein [Anaerolineae bacterium]